MKVSIFFRDPNGHQMWTSNSLVISDSDNGTSKWPKYDLFNKKYLVIGKLLHCHCLRIYFSLLHIE